MSQANANLAAHLLRHAIGFDPIMRSARLALDNTFPPHDIEQIEDDKYRLTLAVAGFTKDEIELTEHQGVLTVKGSKTLVSDNKFLHKGIAYRDFKREWHLGDHVKVSGADMENGLLIINLDREIPEDSKPKQITIG